MTLCGGFFVTVDMMISDFFPDFEQLRVGHFAGVQCTKPSIMIAMTPRTGSTHLCAALRVVTGMGGIHEIFNPRGVIENEKAKLGVTRFSDYVRAFDIQPGRHFVFKSCWRDFWPVSDNFRTIFPI